MGKLSRSYAYINGVPKVRTFDEVGPGDWLCVGEAPTTPEMIQEHNTVIPSCTMQDDCPMCVKAKQRESHSEPQ